jgi:hypothetical protein
MRNVVLGLATGMVLLAGCTVTVNGKVHKYGLDGEEKTEEPGKGKGNVDPDSLAAELAAGTTPTGQSTTLKSDFAPNPTVLGTFSSQATVNVSQQPHGVSSCYGYVGESPAAVVKFTSAMQNTRISAPGAGLILAEFGDRQYVCKEAGYGGDGPNVMLSPEWPAGDVRIFVGGQQGKTYNYEIRVEDEKRPIDILWKGKAKTIDVAEVPKDPIIVSEVTPKTAGVKGSRCNHAFFREVPDVAFQLKRPLGDISIEVRSAKPIEVQLVGPLTADGRNIPTQCLNDDRTSIGRMEAGLYGLRIGTETSGAEVLYHVVLRGKDTSKNPVLPPTKFVDEATVDESVVTWHFPQLTVQEAEAGDANREALFLTAPKAIFVFPKFNMDKSVAEVMGASGDSSKGAPAPEYPKENEPLLLLDKGGHVMAADGSLFRVNLKDLQADPGGAVAIPAAPRNTGLSFERALAAKGPEDAKSVAAYEKAQKAVQSCYDRVNNSIEGGMENACAALEKTEQKAKETLEKDLAKTRAARRAASLAKVKPRLETLFKK